MAEISNEQIVRNGRKRLIKEEYRKYFDYLRHDRGLKIETIKDFHLGVDPNGNILIPIVTDGDLLGVKKRIDPFTVRTIKSKYINPAGISVQLFNVDKKQDGVLLIVEGEFDVMSLYQYGFNAVCQTAGAGLNKQNLERLFGENDEIIVAFDNDLPGQKKMATLAKTAQDMGITLKYFRFPSNYKVKDWNELIVKLQANGFDETKIADEIESILQSNLISQIEMLTADDDGNLPSPLAVTPLSQKEAPPIEYLVSPWIPENAITLITGQPASLKSMFVQYLISKTLKGQSVVQMESKPLNGKVLLIDQESHLGALKDRFTKFSGNQDLILMPDLNVYFDENEASNEDKPDYGIVSRILQTIREENVSLVIIDTLRRVNLKRDENQSRDMSKFYAQLGEITKEATVLLIHHENKGRNGSYRGSGDIQAAVDSHISFVRDSSNKSRITISHQKARYTNAFSPVKVEFVESEDSWNFEFIEVIDESEYSEEESTEELKAQLLEFITSSNDGRSTKEIHEFSGGLPKGQKYMIDLAKELAKNNQIEINENYKGRSTYYLAKKTN